MLNNRNLTLKITVSPILIFFAYICFSCGNNLNRDNDKLTCPYHVNKINSVEETFVSATKIVPLITDDTTTISNITKFLASDSMMFIFDKDMQSIYIFDSIGHQKNYFNHHGAGPGEYIDANDIAIDENSNLYVADIGTQRIIKYESPDYIHYEVYDLGKAFTNFDIYDDRFYLSNLSEDNDLKIKLASMQLGNDSLKILSMAKFDNEYRAVGAALTHLWKSDSTLLFYNRFTPYIYKLKDGFTEGFISFNNNDIPDEELITELIKLPAPQRYTKLSEPTDKIIDISSCFESDEYILIEIRTMPLKYIAIHKESGDYKILQSLLTNNTHSSIGLIGVCDGYFVTATTGDENNNPEIVFFEIK